MDFPTDHNGSRAITRSILWGCRPDDGQLTILFFVDRDGDGSELAAGDGPDGRLREGERIQVVSKSGNYRVFLRLFPGALDEKSAAFACGACFR